MSSNIGNLAATVTLDIDPFQSSTRVLQTQMRSIDSALKAQETSWKNNSKNINAQKAQYSLTGKAMQNYSQQLKLQKDHYEKLKTEIGDVNSATVDQKTQLLAAENQVNKTTGKIAELTSNYEKLGRQIAINESNFTKAGAVLESFGDKAQKTGKFLSGIGNGMSTYVTAPIVAGVGLVTKAAMDWETAFAGVKKTNDEVVDANGKVVYSYQDLEDGLRGLAKELPSTHTEIAAVAEAAGQLGIQTENVTAFTKTMIDLGESTNMSAETAATELARFANITGMSQDKFSNLGSALVDLGNNFATTESEISAMSLRLAGAGKQIGMSEGDILGFAAALSSVGVEAEAGGSAFSKVMTQMQLAVEKGGGAFDDLKETASNAGLSWEQVSSAVRNGGNELKSVAGQMGLTSSELKKMVKEADSSAGALDNFANVAGLTSEQFSQMFKDDPAGAIMKFVEGLATAEERGTSAIAVLDEMGITEVRLRDSLLRAAGASEIFSDAVSTGNRAFEENTALSEEAAKRYETVESQLKMLKNEVVDVAIEFGGPFLAALRDGVQAAKPFISTLSDLAKKFSEMPKEQQQMIIKMLGITAAAGPALSILGKFLEVSGGGISTIGKISKKFGEWSGMMKTSKSAFEIAEDGTVRLVGQMADGAGKAGLFSSAMTTMTTSVGGYTGALGALTSPLGIAVAAIAAGAVVYQVWGKDALDSASRTREWGTSVSEETGQTLEKVREFSHQSGDLMANFDKNVNVSAENVKEQFNAMKETIKTTVDEINKKNQELIDKLPEEQKKGAEERAKAISKSNEQLVQSTESMTQRVIGIYQKHNGDVSKMTDTEKEIVMSARESMIQAEVNLLELSGNKKKAVMVAMSNDISQMNMKQAGEYAGYLEEAIQKSNESYDKQIKQQKEALEAGLISQTEYSSKVAEIQANHNVSTEAFAEKLYEYYKKMGDVDADVGKVRLAFEELGLDYDEVAARVESASDRVSESNSIIAKSSEDMANETIIANEKWNSLVYDEKTGEVKTNVKEVIADAASSEEGWNNLEYMLKEAQLNSNARDTVAVAIGENGRWNELEFHEKLLVANGDEARVQLWDTINEAGLWNEYEVVSKQIGANNVDAMSKIFASRENLDEWNRVSAELKDIIVNDQASDRLIPGTALYREWEKLKDSLKNITIKADTSGATIAKEAIDSVNDKNVMIRVQYHGYNTGEAAIRSATGQTYHAGGLTWLGDGGKAEPFLTPKGDFGISPPDWTLFDLPRGTKIWPSIQKMRETLPKFASGTQFDDTVLSRIKIDSSSIGSPSGSDGNSVIVGKIDYLVSAMMELLDGIRHFEFVGNVQLDNKKEVGKWLASVVDDENRRDIARKNILKRGQVE